MMLMYPRDGRISGHCYAHHLSRRVAQDSLDSHPMVEYHDILSSSCQHALCLWGQHGGRLLPDVVVEDPGCLSP